MPRRLVAVSLLALAGIATAVALTVFWYARMRQAERNAAATLVSVGTAQRAFRARPGHGGYATDLASLTMPCPADSRAALDQRQILAARYTLVVRAAQDAAVLGTDCHGRTMASDYYAAAQPATPLDGRQAFAMTARARIYLFFDGIAPREADMRPGGLAVPLDTVERFKIP